MGRHQAHHATEPSRQFRAWRRGKFDVIEPRGSRRAPPAAKQTVDRDLLHLAGVEVELDLRPVVVSQQRLGAAPHRVLQLVNVQHGAVRSANFAHVLRFDPAGEPVNGARFDRDLRRPAHIPSLLGGNLHTATTGVAQVRDRELPASTVRRRSPTNRPAIALFFEG